MRAKNRVHENNFVDRFDTRYSEHLSDLETRLDCCKAIMIIQLPHLFSLYTLYTELSYITPIQSHFPTGSLYLTFSFPIIQFLFNRFSKFDFYEIYWLQWTRFMF